MNRLPELVVRLGRDVDWRNELRAVDPVAKLIADFYSVKAPLGKSKQGVYRMEKGSCARTNGLFTTLCFKR